MARTAQALLLIGAFLLPTIGARPALAFTSGDVFVSVSNGQVQERTPAGGLVRTLNTGTASFTTGSGFDAAGNLYVTDFNGQAVSKFDPTGASAGTFGSGYNADPESIVFDAAGNVYVGQADGSHALLKLSPTGTLLQTFTPATERRGTDWNDLAADQCTMYYTSEGVFVKRFNVCTNTQLADFNGAALPGADAYALRLLPSGGLLVADSSAIVRLDSAGNQVQTYGTAQGFTGWFALNLDPDGTSFWSADFGTGNVFRFDIATGSVISSFNTGTGPGTVFGLSVRGEITVAKDTTPPSCDLTAVIDGPPKQIQVTVQDSDGGLKSITGSTTNATLSIPSFSTGDTNPVVVTATKVDQSQSATVSLTATDTAGNVTTCDPAIVSVGTNGSDPRSQVVRDLVANEHNVTVHNGTPGVTSIVITANGHQFVIDGLKNGDVRSIDIASALRKGDRNKVVVRASGHAEGDATVLIST